MPEIEKIAAIGADFYSLIQELGKNNDAAITSTLLYHATAVRTCLRIVLQEYDGIHGQIGKVSGRRDVVSHSHEVHRKLQVAREGKIARLQKSKVTQSLLTLNNHSCFTQDQT